MLTVGRPPGGTTQLELVGSTALHGGLTRARGSMTNGRACSTGDGVTRPAVPAAASPAIRMVAPLTSTIWNEALIAFMAPLALSLSRQVEATTTSPSNVA